MIKVLIGLFLRFLFVCFSVFRFCFSIYRTYLGRGPVGPRLEPSLSEGRSGRGGEGGCAGLRPVRGLSDFASKGERCDTYVCKEGPSGWGSQRTCIQGPGLSQGEFFISSSPTLLGLALNTVSYPSILTAPLGTVWYPQIRWGCSSIGLSPFLFLRWDKVLLQL